MYTTIECVLRENMLTRPTKLLGSLKIRTDSARVYLNKVFEYYILNGKNRIGLGPDPVGYVREDLILEF